MDKSLKDFDTFVFDLDGTLLNSKKEILSSSLEVIKKLQNLNKNIVIATGRPYYRVYQEIDKLNITLPVIGGNGSMIYDPKNKEVLFFESIKNTVAKEIASFLEKNKIDYLAYDKNIMLAHNYSKPKWFDLIIYPFLNSNNPFRWPYDENVLLSKNIDDYEIGKFLIITENINQEKIDKLKEIINKYSKDIYSVESQKGVIDIMPNNISKGQALKTLAKLKNINLNKTVTFGDAANDISMFNEAGYKVAMFNAVEELKSIANFVTKSNNDDGIACFIDKLVKND